MKIKYVCTFPFEAVSPVIPTYLWFVGEAQEWTNGCHKSSFY